MAVFSNCRRRLYVFCRKIATTTMDGRAGDASRLKPMDAREQPVLASATNVLEAALQKHFPSRKGSALLHFCSSSPNITPPSRLPKIIV